MADYPTDHELQALIGPLKGAAIDAYMKQNGWMIGADHYSFTIVTQDASNTQEVTRPSPKDGEGGGKWSDSSLWMLGPDTSLGKRMDAQWKAEFDAIRTQIDETFSVWRYLPNPSDFVADMELLRQVRVTLTSTVPSEWPQGMGDIYGYLTTMNQDAHDMRGGVITNFKNKFLSMLPAAIVNMNLVALILGSAVGSEQEVWIKARNDVKTIITTTTNSFSTYAAQHGGDASTDLTFSVIGAVLSGLGAFFPGADILKGVLAGVSASLSLVKAGYEYKQKVTSIPASSYDSIMEQFGNALADLNAAIKQEEAALQDSLTRNHDEILSNDAKNGFDLEHPLQDIKDPSDLGTVTIVRSAVDEIAGSCMPGIADELGAANYELRDVGANAGPWLRDDSIGLGEQGCYGDWLSLKDLLTSLIGDLSWETSTSAKTLRLAINAFLNVDDEAAERLAQHAKQIDDGRGSPWDGRF